MENEWVKAGGDSMDQGGEWSMGPGGTVISIRYAVYVVMFNAPSDWHPAQTVTIACIGSFVSGYEDCW